MGEITSLLRRAGDGDKAAEQQLLQRLYGDLRRMAAARWRAGSVAEPTTLVHEFYLRLRESEGLEFPDRGHFMAYAARVMRSIVVDLARERGAARRGSGAKHVPLDTTLADKLPAEQDDALGVHEALAELQSVDARLAAVVEMRYFGGFSEAEIAAALQVTERTVQRDWRKARLLLAAMLAPAP